MSIRPNVYVGLAFGYRPISLAPQFADMSTRMYSVQIERGREHSLDDFTPSIITLNLQNNDGALVPSSTSSPYRSGGVTQIKPGVQVVIGEGFEGRVAMAGPVHQYSLNESTLPCRDQVAGINLIARSVNTPTMRVSAWMGKGIQFDGRTQSLWSSLAVALSTMKFSTSAASNHLYSTGATGQSIMAVARIDEKNVARKQHIVGGQSIFGIAEFGPVLGYSSLNQARFFALSSTTVVACSTGWHLLIGVYKKGSKPVIIVDGVRTSGAAVSTSVAASAAVLCVGGLGHSSGSSNRMFKGIIDECALWPGRALTPAETSALYVEYLNKWRPGQVRCRGHIAPLDPFTYNYPDSKLGDVTIQVQDRSGRLTNANYPPTGPSSSTSPPIVVFAGDTPGARLNRILDKALIPTGWRQFDAGASLLLGTTWGVNTMAEALRVARAENGALYTLKTGALAFDARQRTFNEARSITPRTTYSDLSSRLGYSTLQFGYAKIIRNDVVVGNSTYTTELKSTASFDQYGIVSTDRSGALNRNKNDMIEQGRMILTGYSTGRYTPISLTVKPYESTAAYMEVCMRELRDRIRIQHKAVGAARSTTDVIVEKETVTISKNQQLVTWGLDACRWSTILPSSATLLLDSTVTAHRLNHGRLSF